MAGSDSRRADPRGRYPEVHSAGGKHNDLEDVGLDTYHHTFFEMLGTGALAITSKKKRSNGRGNWSLAIWKFPKNRIYATVYKPGPGDPSEFDQEAYDYWAQIFTAAGLDPKVHIVYGGKKDNFWMMGDTGPCGPCSEIHVDLTPNGDTRGALGQQGQRRMHRDLEPGVHPVQCQSGRDLLAVARPACGYGHGLRARHRDHAKHAAVSRDFSRVVSNYETDIFRPIFDALEKLSGKTICVRRSQRPARPATPNRRRSTSPFASSPIISAR